MPKIEIKLDSTSLGSSNCILNYKRTVIGELEDNLGGYKETPKASMIYGVATHGFVDTMYKTGGNYKIARDKMLSLFSIPKLSDDKATWLSDEEHITKVCYNLWNSYIEEDSTYEVLMVPAKCHYCNGTGQEFFNPPNGQIDYKCTKCKGVGAIVGPASELTFEFPFFEDKYIKVFLTGTIDNVGKFKNGCYAIRDWKTTKDWNVDKYLKQYELSRQLRFYTLACKIMAEEHPESILGKVGATKMGAFIDGVFLKAASSETEYHRSRVFQFSDKEIFDFRMMLDYFCVKLSAAVEHRLFMKEGILNGTCVSPYGLCKFWNACQSNDTVAKLLLDRDFKRKHYDPLHFND